VAAILLVLIIYMVWRATHRVAPGIAMGRSIPVAQGRGYSLRALVRDSLPRVAPGNSHARSDVESQFLGGDRG
jgi:hypothetical protein